MKKKKEIQKPALRASFRYAFSAARGHTKNCSTATTATPTAHAATEAAKKAPVMNLEPVWPSKSHEHLVMVQYISQMTASDWSFMLLRSAPTLLKSVRWQHAEFRSCRVSE